MPDNMMNAQMGAAPPQVDDANLQNLSTSELEDMLTASIVDLQSLVDSPASGPTALGEDTMEEEAPQGPAVLSGVPPETVAAATGEMVEAGWLMEPSTVFDREVATALDRVLAVDFPGLFDTKDPADVTEALSQIAAGTLPLPRAPRS